MIKIDVNEDVKNVIIDAGLLAMNQRASKLIAEIHFFDGYSEFPFKYYDENHQVITETGSDYDDARKTYFKNFMGDLYKLCETRKGLDKGDKNYWNHCIVVIDRSGENNIIFDYSEKLEEAREKKLLDNLGEELYTKYKQEREQEAPSESISSENVSSQSSANNNEMSINQLLGAIYQEIVTDMPENWISFQIESEIFQKNGQDIVNNYFRYQLAAGSNLKEFTPSNIFLPSNALKLIQKKMKEEENDGWRKALFVFNADKSVNINVLEKE